ncbi:MAG: MoaD/ThiS family protein [Saprospiraceae bacterium]|nr:MoaD/ThiS family protein [Saprospiraceae bacterium]
MASTNIVNVKVRAFGIAADIVGGKNFELEIPGQCSVRELKKMIIENYPRFETIQSFHIAVGDEYAKDDDQIIDQEQISILPPVSGG